MPKTAFCGLPHSESEVYYVKSRYHWDHAAPLAGLISARAESIHHFVPSVFTDVDSI